MALLASDPPTRADIAAITAHAAVFDFVLPLAGTRVLVHDAHGPVGFCAVQLAKIAGALAVVAVVPGHAARSPLAALQAVGRGPDLLLDARRDDVAAAVRHYTGRDNAIDRIVQGRFGWDPGADLAVLAPGGVIAVHGTPVRDAGSGWWPELLAAALTLRLVTPAALPPARLARAVADLNSLRDSGDWCEPPLPPLRH